MPAEAPKPRPGRGPTVQHATQPWGAELHRAADWEWLRAVRTGEGRGTGNGCLGRCVKGPGSKRRGEGAKVSEHLLCARPCGASSPCSPLPRAFTHPYLPQSYCSWPPGSIVVTSPALSFSAFDLQPVWGKSSSHAGCLLKTSPTSLFLLVKSLSEPSVKYKPCVLRLVSVSLPTEPHSSP